MLFLGSLVVMELCKWIMDKYSDRFYQDKRLLNNLLSRHANLGKAFATYHRSLNRYIQPDTPIAIDMTDLAKPRARKKKYLASVRDGSEGKLVTRYVDAFHFLIMGNRNKYIEKWQIINVKYRFVELFSAINQELSIQYMFALE